MPLPKIFGLVWFSSHVAKVKETTSHVCGYDYIYSEGKDYDGWQPMLIVYCGLCIMVEDGTPHIHSFHFSRGNVWGRDNKKFTHAPNGY